TRFRELSSNNFVPKLEEICSDTGMICSNDFMTCLFDMPRLPNQLGTVLGGALLSADAALTPFFASGERERAKEGKQREGRKARFEAACRCHAFNCRGAPLRPRGERSGAIAFARSLQPVAGYPEPKARCGGGRHQAGGEPQAGLSTADSGGGPR